MKLSSYLWHNAFARKAVEQGFVPRRFQGGRQVLIKRESPLTALILGVERALWPFVEAAYPEWNKIFLRRSATKEDILAELRFAPDLRIMIGISPPRALLHDILQLNLPLLALSPAPLPAKTGYGFILEPHAPWYLARRESEVEILLKSGVLTQQEALLAYAETLLPAQSNAKATLILEKNAPWSAQNWHLPGQHLAFCETVLQYGKLVSYGHPQTLLALLHGIKTQVKGRFFIETPAPRREILAALLLLSRYVTPQGELVAYA